MVRSRNSPGEDCLGIPVYISVFGEMTKIAKQLIRSLILADWISAIGEHKPQAIAPSAEQITTMHQWTSWSGLCPSPSDVPSLLRNANRLHLFTAQREVERCLLLAFLTLWDRAKSFLCDINHTRKHWQKVRIDTPCLCNDREIVINAYWYRGYLQDNDQDNPPQAPRPLNTNGE